MSAGNYRGANDWLSAESGPIFCLLAPFADWRNDLWAAHGATCRRICRYFRDLPQPKNSLQLRLNDFQCARSNVNGRIQVGTLCVGYSDYGG
jgi:hypothetical protein